MNPVDNKGDPAVAIATEERRLTRPLRRVRLLSELILAVGVVLLLGVPAVGGFAIFLVLLGTELIFLWRFMREAEERTIRDWL